MEINIINQTAEKRWNRYKKDFLTIAQKTEELLKIKQRYCASVFFVTQQ